MRIENLRAVQKMFVNINNMFGLDMTQDEHKIYMLAVKGIGMCQQRIEESVATKVAVRDLMHEKPQYEREQ